MWVGDFGEFAFDCGGVLGWNFGVRVGGES